MKYKNVYFWYSLILTQQMIQLIYLKRILIFLFSACLMLPLISSGQNEFWGEAGSELKFKHLTSEQGLSSDITSVILKDNLGFMWFGTDAGLNRYDGFQIITYDYNPTERNSLSNGVIKALYEDHQGRIWIGTEKGLNLYQPNSESIEYFLSEVDKPRSLSNNIISSLSEDKRDDLWVGTSYGLNKLTKWKDGKPSFQHFYAESNSSTSISDNRIFCLFVDSKDNLWIGTEGGGLNLLTHENKENQTFEFKQISDSKEFEETIIYSIIEDSKGNILVGTNNGFTIISTVKSEFKFNHYKAREEGGDWLLEDNVYSIAEDKQGRIWLATFGDGLFLFDPADEVLLQYNHDIYNNESLSRNQLYSINTTDDDLLWIAARETGIDRVNPGMQNFTHLRHHPNNVNSLSNNVVKSISESPDGKFWFGTFGGGLNLYDPTTNKFTVFKSGSNSKTSLNSDIVETTCFDHLGRLWIGTSKGLNMYDPKTGEVEGYKSRASSSNSVLDSYIWCVFPARDRSGIWVATYDGLNKFDWNEEKFHHFRNDPLNDRSLSYNYIRSVYEDNENNLWICTWGGGLNRLVLADNNSFDNVEFIHYKNRPNDTTSLSNDLVNTIFEDSKDNLWIGTQAGLNRYDKESGEFRSFFKTDGLADNVVKGILEDRAGDIWISTQDGLSRFDYETGKFRSYYKKDGLQGNIFNLSSCFRNSRDELMFGGNSGVSIFDPLKITETTEFPELFFTNLSINNREIYPNEMLNGRVLYKRSLNDISEIELHHDENTINLEFTAIEYLYPEKIEFAYMLEGADKDWNYTSYNNRMVTYTGLKEGRYRFRVKGSNSNGEWRDNEISINFKVTPPFWRTHFAYFIYFIFFVIIVYLIRQQVKTRTKIKLEFEKEKEKHKRQAELDRFKLQLFTNISHEFRTPLTLIAAPLQKLLSSKGTISEKQKLSYLSTMNRSVSILTKLVDQLLDFRKAENNKMRLRVAYTDIGQQLKDIYQNFQDFADQKNIRFSFESDHNSVHYWYDADKLEKIVYNLLSNAFKFTSIGGEITVMLKNRGEVELPKYAVNSSRSNFYCVVIEDTGVGISDANKKYIFDRFSQIDSGKLKNGGTGIGLSFAKNMVELHHGFIDLESVEHEGSKFFVWLPANEKLFKESELVRQDSREELSENRSEFSLPFLPDTKDSGVDSRLGSKEITILIVEDYSDLRDFMAGIFSSKYNVLLASNGREGLEKVDKSGPDLIITDVMMPEMDGLEFTKRVKKNLTSSHIPIIMLTAKNTVNNEIEGLKTGADYYISKPFNVERLQLVVNNIIKGRKKLHKKYTGIAIPDPKGVAVVSADEKFIARVGEIIELNIAEPEFSVELLAVETGLSTVHLYRKLKALTGVSPNELIRSFRMKRATQLLEQNKMMISEVAYAVGFSDPKYFRRYFKNVFGISPSDYGENSMSTIKKSDK